MLLPGAVARASSVMVPATRSGVAAPAPIPEQEADVKTYPEGMDSVMTVAAEGAASVCSEPETATPCVDVVMTSAAPNPLSPLKVNGPAPPLEVFESRIVGCFSLVKVQAMTLPGAVANALRTSAPVARFGVAEPAPIPVQPAETSA